MAQARTATALVVVLAALAVAGCGPLGGKSDEEKARDAITELIDARNQHDFKKVCGLISSQLLAKIQRPGTPCQKALEQAVPKVAGTAALTIRVDQVRVRGDSATVDATISQTGGAGRAQTILMVKEGGDWKFAKLGF